jgi:hypothetical protein
MNMNSSHKSIWIALARTMILGGLAACIAAGPVFAQSEIAGNFTLTEDARFGNTLLPPGQYKFSLEPVGTIQSVRSIRQSPGHLVLVVLRPEKSGPMASLFAMASPNTRQSETSELVLQSEKGGALAGTMYLEKEGLMVDFRWWAPKVKSQVVAERIVPVASPVSARSGN